jgi:hypothetical protein
MLNKSTFSTSITAWAVVPSLLFLCAGLARAQTSTPARYSFVVASGFLCDPGDSGTCPAVAKSANGDSYEISGAGTFDLQNKSIKGAGTFTHKSTNGSVLETGVWTASALISFDSYGIASPAVMQRGLAGGGPQIGYRRLPMRPSPLPTGGLAIFHILLSPVSGITKTAVLQVNCALGNVPGEHSVEGIRIWLDRNNLEYAEEASGRVIFLAMRPELSAPAKVPEQGARPEAPVQPQE